jgi:hypothetical protein
VRRPALLSEEAENEHEHDFRAILVPQIELELELVLVIGLLRLLIERGKAGRLTTPRTIWRVVPACSTALKPMVISRGRLANGIARERSVGSALGEGFLDDLVGDIERLADRLEPAREPFALEPFEPSAGMIDFFQDKTHFGGGQGAAPGPLNCPVFCGGPRDAADQLCRDHARSKFRNKIID